MLEKGSRKPNRHPKRFSAIFLKMFLDRPVVSSSTKEAGNDESQAAKGKPPEGREVKREVQVLFSDDDNSAFKPTSETTDAFPLSAEA